MSESETYIPNGRLRLLIQISGFVFMAGVAWWRISVLEGAVREMRTELGELRATTVQTSISVARLEERDRIGAVIQMLVEDRRKRDGGSRAWTPYP